MPLVVVQNITKSFFHIITKLTESDSPVIIIGDLNAPDIDWSILSADSDFSNKICDLLFRYNLNQLVEDATYVRGNVLGIVVTNIEEAITDIHIHLTDNLPIKSDHHLVMFDL